VVSRKEDEADLNILVYTFTKIPDFQQSLKKCFIEEFFAAGKPPMRIVFSKVWLESIQGKMYRNVVFEPDTTVSVPEDLLNLWSGPKWGLDDLRIAYENMDDEQRRVVHALNCHSYEVLCCGNFEQFIYLYCLVASKCRNPGFHPTTACFFAGAQGTGKSMFIDLLLTYFGRHGVRITHISQLFDNFNGHLKDKVFIHLEEASVKWCLAYHNQLKAYITADTWAYNGKHKDLQHLKLSSTIFSSSNDEVPCPIGATERRFCCFEVSEETHRNNREDHSRYYDLLHKFKEDEEIHKAWLYQFHNEEMISSSLIKMFGKFDISKFPRRSTDFLKDNALKAGATYVAKFHAHCLERGFYYSAVKDPTLNVPPPWSHRTLDQIFFGDVEVAKQKEKATEPLKPPSSTTDKTDKRRDRPWKQTMDGDYDSVPAPPKKKVKTVTLNSFSHWHKMVTQDDGSDPDLLPPTVEEWDDWCSLVTKISSVGGHAPARNPSNLKPLASFEYKYDVLTGKGYDMTKAPICWHTWMSLNPPYKDAEDGKWLGAYNMTEMYNLFRQFTQDCGFKRTVGPVDFRDQTLRLFGLGKVSEKLIIVNIKSEWLSLRDIRVSCSGDPSSWNFRKYTWKDNDLNEAPVKQQLYVDLGSLDYARDKFYKFSGVDTSGPSQKYSDKDLASASRQVYTCPDAKEMFKKFIEDQ
jgi:hypothetical protein